MNRNAGTLRNGSTKVGHREAPREKLCVDAFRSVPRSGGIYSKTNQSTINIYLTTYIFIQNYNLNQPTIFIKILI